MSAAATVNPAARPVSAAGHRVEMVRRAIQGRPGCRLSQLEVERKGPTYTVETLRELRRRDEKTEFFFLMSYGSLREFPAWREPAEIIRLCTLAVAPRSGYERPAAAALEASLPGLAGRIVWLEMAAVDISATTVRAQVSRGEAITGLVPPPVAAYIREQGLYRGRPD